MWWKIYDMLITSTASQIQLAKHVRPHYFFKICSPNLCQLLSPGCESQGITLIVTKAEKLLGHIICIAICKICKLQLAEIEVQNTQRNCTNLHVKILKMIELNLLCYISKCAIAT